MKPRIGLHTLLLFAAAIALAGASSKAQAPPPARDKYDPAGMVMKSPPAKVTDRRNSGPFAKGDSLSFGAVVLDQRIGAKAGS